MKADDQLKLAHDLIKKGKELLNKGKESVERGEKMIENIVKSCRVEQKETPTTTKKKGKLSEATLERLRKHLG